MGTNYYATYPFFGLGREKVHIGKSSGGWTFLLRIHPAKGIYGLSEWVHLLRQKKVQIVDEYEAPVPVAEMLDIITQGQWENGRYFYPNQYNLAVWDGVGSVEYEGSEGKVTVYPCQIGAYAITTSDFS